MRNSVTAGIAVPVLTGRWRMRNDSGRQFGPQLCDRGLLHRGIRAHASAQLVSILIA